MAHGPVNKAWFVSLSANLIFKINEAQYTEIRDQFPDNIVTVSIGDRTDRTVYVWPIDTAVLEGAGYEHKEGNIWGRLDRKTYDFTA